MVLGQYQMIVAAGGLWSISYISRLSRQMVEQISVLL